MAHSFRTDLRGHRPTHSCLTRDPLWDRCSGNSDLSTTEAGRELCSRRSFLRPSWPGYLLDHDPTALTSLSGLLGQEETHRVFPFIERFPIPESTAGSDVN